jgi:hypothetical protein
VAGRVAAVCNWLEGTALNCLLLCIKVDCVPDAVLRSNENCNGNCATYVMQLCVEHESE